MCAFGDYPEATLEIINIVPRRGPAGIIAPSCDAATALAVHEINSGTGILGRELRVTTIDGGRCPQVVANEVSALLATGMVHAITGCHASSVRRAVATANAGRVPYLFATAHEGLDEQPGVFLLGEHPASHTLAAVRWLRREYGVRRLAIIGSDYIWPRETARAVRRSLPDPADIVLEQFVPIGAADFRSFLREPALDRADCVLILLVGAEIAHFNRQFAAAGRTAPRLSPATDENVLLAGGPDANRDLYVPSSFFLSDRLPDGLARRIRYRRMHGDFAPALTSFGNAVYEGMHALRAIAESVRSLHVPDLHRAFTTGVRFHTPGGLRDFHGNQAVQPCYLARAAGVGFAVVDRIY
ncbi:substrate-binding domain-containing protein [Nocardia bovistercoris]|uniref:Substrate-binding domain-containing protein n=1 Tax=Nocardia bovistercoris TaxID=2785916 RepID=A0A931IHT5_9NOCA|nr:substrate-binding domain-containing protein [Nocardia bovistercoris]MBH0780631.1 substrate-binding domain-containing protein [Nocardia bovistercoris]